MNAKGLQFKFLYFAEHGTFKMTRIAATSALITVAKISITGSVLITGDATSHYIFFDYQIPVGTSHGNPVYGDCPN